MKILSFLLALATGTLVAVCLVQGRKLSDQKTQLAGARVELEHNAAEIEKLSAAQKHAEAEHEAMLQQASELAARIQPRQPATAAAIVEVPANSAPNPVEAPKPGAEGAGFGKMLSKMMQDPEMKKMMRAQQRLVLDQLYSPLAKKLALTPEETDKFKGLLADNMMNGAEKATSLFGDGAATNRTQAIEAISASQKDFDAQMKSFLGDARYAEYKDYQQTVGERAQLNQFRQASAGGDKALTDQQTDQLLALMNEEKQKAAARGESVMSDSQDQAKLQELLAGGQTDKLMESQESINQRVYDRARDLLTPSQLSSFGTFQTNQLQMMRLGMTMAKKMFAPDTEPTGVAAPAQ